MGDDKTRVFEAGEMASWSEFRLRVPGLPPAAKCFLKDRIGLNGMEVSLNAMQPGQAVPFVHRHRSNEELYIFLSGDGEFQADGKTFPIRAGSCIRCAPEVRRSWRNSGKSELIFVVIQAPNQAMATSLIQDGELVEEPLCWDA